MERFCQTCHVSGVTSRCSKCQVVYYCSAACQKKHWPMHKHLCQKTGTVDEQAIAIDKGFLHFTFVNPRLDRSIDIHGCDTSVAFSLNNHSRALISYMKLDADSCKTMRVDPDFTLPYGHCMQNVRAVVQEHGGVRILGWVIYEGKHMVEAEFHAVWLPQGEIDVINVTTCIKNRMYCGLFIPDPSLEGMQKAPSNVVYWK